jgi:hypothetical protein
MNPILAVSSHFMITTVLAKKQIFSNWEIKGEFVLNLGPQVGEKPRKN